MPEMGSGGGKPGVWFETRGDESREPLLLLHGFTGTHRTWDALAERLASSRFLIMPDLPGHGRSGVSRSEEAMNVRSTSDSVARLLQVAGGGRKCAILGYSLGGRIALELASRHKGLLSSLILEGASPGIEEDRERAERRSSDRKLADEIERHGLGWFVDAWEQGPLFASQRELPPEVVERIRRDRLSNSALGLAMSLRAAGAGEMASLWGKLEGLKIPVLIVVGDRDRKYSEVGEEMLTRIPESRLVVVEGAGHCPHLERPREFAREVERFLADTPSILRKSRDHELEAIRDEEHE